jgi:hypothetical protein
MRKFVILTLIAFGFLLSYQTIKIMSQQRYVADINVRQFKDKTLKVISSDIFAEKNAIQTFKLRYKADLKYVFENKDERYFNLDAGDAQVVIYPSFAFDSINKKFKLLAADKKLVPNLSKLMDNHTAVMKELYSRQEANYAVPMAYIPYAIFFNVDKIKPTTTGKEYFNKNLKVALADDYGCFLALTKFMGLPLDSGSVAVMRKTFNKENTVFYNLDKLEEAFTILNDAKPSVIVAPVYLKSFFERRAGSLEMILPDEGSYAPYYLVSIIGQTENELSNVFLNHVIDPLILKNYSDIFTIPITNQVSLNTMSAVLYNSLKMNDQDYFKKIMILKNQKEYETAVKLYKSFREGL